MRRYIKIIVALVLFTMVIVFYFSISFPLFSSNYSTTLRASNGELLGAHIAPDEQWRFAVGDSIPHKYRLALIYYEDEYFYKHVGVNPISVLRAAKQNITAGEVVSGGSTITMQLVRLAKGGRRTFINKIIESFQALRVELSLSKEDILSLYAAHAPFGGNVVGIEAAAWRYFNRSPHQLSWAECAMLAVLPNAPGLIHTGKNREKLLAKRNSLLYKLYTKGVIDQTTYSLSLDEEIPQHPNPLEHLAPHLLNRCYNKERGKNYQTTVDIELQREVNNIVNNHSNKLSYSGVYNAAAIVVDVNSGKVIAYCGNSEAFNGKLCQNHVDIIQSKRSTGSVMKPLLYAAALQDGDILPTQLLADIPTYFKGFAPKNYTRSFDGAVPANEALSRSLNVPAVRMLKEYDVARFCSVLRKAGIKSIDKNPEHYGLSLILGGAEGTLFEFVGAYASMMRTLNTYTTTSALYYSNEFQLPIIMASDTLDRGSLSTQYPLFSAGAIYSTLQAMTGVARPEGEEGWQLFTSGRTVAWKTGTSFGFRDAWSIGITPDYVVGVWVGNATGEGRPEIIGGSAAAPIMFDIFRALPPTSWIDIPYDDMTLTSVCAVSGHLAGEFCPRDTIYVPNTEQDTELCPHHHLVHLDKEEKHIVTSNNYRVSDMKHRVWFTLPPAMELYYSKNNPTYKKLPPAIDGGNIYNTDVMEFIYPQSSNKVFLPKGIDGEIQPVVLKVAHNTFGATIYWHIDEEYIGKSEIEHEKEIFLSVGKHLITLVDDRGNTLYRWIECIGTGNNYRSGGVSSQH